MGSTLSSTEHQGPPTTSLLKTRPLTFEPVLASALLEWCERVENDGGQFWYRGCKKSLEDEDFWRQELRDGCPFCTLLYEAIWKLYGDYLIEGGSLKWRVPYPRTPEAIRDDGGNAIYFCVPDDANLGLRLRKFPSLWRGKGPSGEVKPIPRDTASEKTLQTVKHWIYECTSSHPLCSPADVATLPTRVIAVGSGEADVRLLETEKATGMYACLSHPWGKRPLVRTLKENISQFKARIPWSALPRTFQDAINFTRRLGLQYIWIDSLCIVQDDPLDWQREAAQMATIYQHAYVTLAASKATDSSRGLYTSPLDPKYQTQQLSLINDVEDTDFPLNACSDLLHIDGFFDYFPISRRAWVYQERLLSARVVHFAGAEVNWECNSARNCECGKISSGAEILPDKMHFAGSIADLNGKFTVSDLQAPTPTSDAPNQTPNYSTFSPSLLHSSQWGQSIKAWRQAVKQYAQLNLTFPKDRFPALAGIAKTWNAQYETQYLAGLWRESIHLDLLWLVYKPCRRPDAWRAPTWSWASLEHTHQELLRFDSDPECMNSGKGSWFSLGRIGTEDYAAVAEVLEAVCVPAGVDATGELRSAHLVLWTYVLQGTLLRWPGVLVEYGCSPVWLVVGDVWVAQGDTHTRGLQLDTGLDDTQGPWSMLVSVVRVTDFGLNTDEGPEMACLVVRERSEASTMETEYERVGYVRFVERGFSQGFSISSERANLEPDMRGWARRYRREVDRLRQGAGNVEKSALERLVDLFHEAGRQTIKIV
ncbi:hypothetical protein SLS60_007339 [Paraconiothyrium brasiliense]|uniref:Heterokaryon incompatibility domain-containing protein n=1 Tax=Paraconiothyrium brasiliense TaxID=300254 RepID=A0ABR3R562_9PLEO